MRNELEKVVSYYEYGRKDSEGNFQKYSETNYKNGKQEGLRTLWYENGQKKHEWNYKDGKREGLQTDYYKNGQKWMEVNFKDGKPSADGFWTYFYKNGQKEFVGN